MDIETVYQILDWLLPFDWLSLSFMKNSFLAILIITPLFGLLSTMVVSNRMAFFADSLGHGAFSGIAIGVIFGAASPIFSLCLFSVLFAVFITYVKEKSRTSTDTVIGVFSSLAVAAGLMLMSKGGSFNKFSRYLIGDILSITPYEIALLMTIAFFVVAVWALIFNRLLLVSVNPSFARSRGISSFALECIFASLVAVVVAMSIQWVGILIINSLLILPGAASRNIANDVKSYQLLAVLISLFSGLSGLIAAYYLDMAVGATVAVIAVIAFFFTLALKNR